MRATSSKIVDQLLLIGVERDDADRMAGSNEGGIGEPLDGFSDDGFGFSLVVTPFAFGVDTLDPTPFDGTGAGLAAGKVIRLLS